MQLEFSGRIEKFLKNKSVFRILFGIIFTFYVVLLFHGNARFSLWEQDEAAYAGFAHNMLRTGNISAPDFLWSTPHRKPPLHFWTIALSFFLFGENEFALRLPSVLFIVLTIVVTFLAVKKLSGEIRAMISSTILATSFLVVALAKISLTDAGLLLFETICAFSLMLFLRAPEWKTRLLFWSALGFGLLMKGPPVLVLAGGMICVIAAWHKRRKALLDLQPWIYFPLSILPLFIWGYCAWKATDGELVQWMIDWYILRRAAGYVFGQAGPPGYFFVLIFLTMLPWSFYFLPALRRLMKGIKKRKGAAITAGGWLVFGWIFYEIMLSKLPSYAVGSFPLIAYLLAGETRKARRQKNDWFFRVNIALSAIFLALFVTLLVYLLALSEPSSLGGRVIHTSAGILLFLFALLVFLTFFRARERWRLFTATSSGFAIFSSFLIWSLILPGLEYERSLSRRVSSAIEQCCERTPVIFMGNYHLPGMAFYLGIRDQAYRELTGIENWREEMASSRHAVLVFDHSNFALFNALYRLPTPIPVSGTIPDTLSPETFYIVQKNETIPPVADAR